MTPYEFWNSTTQWPFTPESDGVVFLASAVHRVGRAVYPQEWHGREPWLDEFGEFRVRDLLPDGFNRLDVKNIQVGRGLLGLKDVKFRPLTGWETFPSPVAGGTLDLRPLTEPEWTEVIAKRNALVAEVERAQGRWKEVFDATFAFLKAGHLKTILRPIRGGSFIDAPNGFWNTELPNVWPRFPFCQVDLDHPFAQATLQAPADRHSNFHLIFIQSASVEGAVRLIERTLRPDGAVGPVKAPRKPRARSLQQTAIAAWVAATKYDHNSQRKSHSEIAELVTDWAWVGEGKKKFHRLSGLSERTVSRYFNDLS